MRQYFPFLSAASNANLMCGGLQKRKMRLAKDLRLLLPLIEVMKIVRLTSLLPDMPRLSLLKPRLWHGRQHAQLSFLNLTRNLCILSSFLSLVLLPNFPPLLTSPTVPLSGSGFGLRRLTEISLFVSQPKTLCSIARGYLSKLR